MICCVSWIVNLEFLGELPHVSTIVLEVSHLEVKPPTVEKRGTSKSTYLLANNKSVS
jgi:hypothetical protein